MSDHDQPAASAQQQDDEEPCHYETQRIANLRAQSRFDPEWAGYVCLEFEDRRSVNLPATRVPELLRKMYVTSSHELSGMLVELCCQPLGGGMKLMSGLYIRRAIPFEPPVQWQCRRARKQRKR